jgi:polysaccharide deacetylase 2 family uncharacterized protein YibQ
LKNILKNQNENRIFLKNSKTRRYTILYEKTIRVWINIPFEPVRRWSKDPNKIKMKNQNEKPKMKIEFFFKIQKQEDTQYYMIRQDEYE